MQIHASRRSPAKLLCRGNRFGFCTRPTGECEVLCAPECLEQNGPMKRRGAMLVVALSVVIGGCGYTRLPEERTDDGLVRVPSRASGGVYRNPSADFTPYKRVILEPP